MIESIVIEDLIVLGRSSPDTMRDGRATICVAGYSPEHGFVRLYPTRLDSPLRTWTVVSVQVERNAQDTREESWKIVGSRSEWASLSDKIQVVGHIDPKDRMKYLEPLISGCVLDINDQKGSLGVVRPVSKKCYFGNRSDYDPTIQMTLLGNVTASDKHRYGVQPRVEYACSRCRSAKGHDQQILEWGVYEWFRKHPGKEDKVWENLFSKQARQEVLFVVGNLARHPNSFVVVSILRIPRLGLQRFITSNPSS